MFPLALLIALGCTGEKPADTSSTGTTPTPTDITGTAVDFGDPCDSNPTAVDLVVGKGELGFAPMDDGDGTVELVHGPQGGYHITLALEGRWFSDAEPAIATMLGFIDDVQLARSVPFVEWRCNGAEGVQQAWNLLLIYDSFPEDLDGQQTHIEVSVIDEAGAEAFATADVEIYDPLLH